MATVAVARYNEVDIVDTDRERCDQVRRIPGADPVVVNDCGTDGAILIGPCRLAEGQYSISLAMGVPAVIDLGYWKDAITFEVSGCDPRGTGYSYTIRYAPTFIPSEMEGLEKESRVIGP